MHTQPTAHLRTIRGPGRRTYANGVMPGDFSDLDAIRVGGDYYAISDAAVCPGSDHSTFHGSGELEDHRSRGRGSDCHRSQTQLRDIWTWTHSNIPSSLDGVIDSTPARRTRLLR